MFKTKMTRSRLSDGELAALVARIQQNYDYDDEVRSAHKKMAYAAICRWIFESVANVI